VLSLLTGTISVDGNPAPGATPVVGFTNCSAVRNDLSNPFVLVQLAPTLPPADMNDASAQTEATVVASFITKLAPDVMLLQGPKADISQRAEFADPPPACPPFAIK
jgi:hypothetical protein